MTLGEGPKDKLSFDGANIQTKIVSRGIFVQVDGELIVEGATFMNANNRGGYSAPIKVDKGKFTMNGGRIVNNYNDPSLNANTEGTFSVGGVYVSDGGEFVLNAGSIDNNKGHVGGVYTGLFVQNGKKVPAIFTMNGGLISNNSSLSINAIGGGIMVHGFSNVSINNGIISNNTAARVGGGIGLLDGFVEEFDGVSYSNTSGSDYEKYSKEYGIKFELNGGLIYKNSSRNGGGIYVSTNNAKINDGYLLNNTAYNMGGAIYVSIAPYTLELKNMLVTANKADSSGVQIAYEGGNGGGFWNCPVGIVDLQDFNSLYIFENSADNKGEDIYIYGKNTEYKINKIVVGDKFYTLVSSITKDGQVIKYIMDGENTIYPRRTTYEMSLKNEVYESYINEAWKNSRVFVIGNTAQKGGGIGSNANIISPGREGNYSIKIEKKWAPSTRNSSIPKVVRVDLLIGDKKYDQVILSSENGWEHEFKNLPFTYEELKEKGLKYVVVEEESDKFYYTVDEKYTPSHTREVGRVTVERKWSEYADSGYRYDDPNVIDSQSLNLYIKDENGNVISKLTTLKLLKIEDWKKSFTSDKLLNIGNEKIDVVYYGHDEIPYPDWGSMGYNGYLDSYDAYLTKNKEGKYILELPFIWLMKDYDIPENLGFHASFDNFTEDVDESHKFIITNHGYYNLPVKKKWISGENSNKLPENIRVYLLGNGKNVLDKDGNKIYLDLNAENNWEGIFEKLKYSTDEDKIEYSIQEENSGNYIVKYGEEGSNSLSFEIIRSEYTPETGDVNNNYSNYEEPVNVNIHLELDGKIIETKKMIISTENRVLKLNFSDIDIMTKNNWIDIVFVRNGENGNYKNNQLDYTLKLVKGENNKVTLYVPTFENLKGDMFRINNVMLLGNYKMIVINEFKPIVPPVTPPVTPPVPPEEPEIPPVTPPAPPEEPEIPPVILPVPPEKHTEVEKKPKKPIEKTVRKYIKKAIPKTGAAESMDFVIPIMLIGMSAYLISNRKYKHKDNKKNS